MLMPEHSRYGDLYEAAGAADAVGLWSLLGPEPFGWLASLASQAQNENSRTANQSVDCPDYYTCIRDLTGSLPCTCMAEHNPIFGCGRHHTVQTVWHWIIQLPIAQTAPEQQRLGPSSHISDKRLPVPETRPSLVPQQERRNASSLAHRSHLHRKVRIS